MSTKRPRATFEDDSTQQFGTASAYGVDFATMNDDEQDGSVVRSASRSPTPTPKLQRLGSNRTSELYVAAFYKATS